MEMRTTTIRRMLAGAIVLGLLAGCGDDAPPVVLKPKAEDPELVAARAEAQTVYEQTCSPCHGVSGAANGIRSADLGISPRNFQDPGWQDSVTDAYIEEITVKGGAALGKSDVMPAHPELADKPRTVTAIREYIRRFPNP